MPTLDAASGTFASAPAAGDAAHRAGDPGRHATGPSRHDPAHHPAPTPAGHDHLPAEEAPEAPHGEHHGDGGGCLMILAACGSASARTVQAATLVRPPAISLRAKLYIAPLPVAVAMGVETPPPRHHA